MSWLYEQKEVTDITQLPEGIIGFVYKITNKETGKFYIGKKSVISTTNKLLTKKEQLAWDKPGRIPKKKKVVKESDWKNYWGSSKVLQQDVKDLGADKFTKELLRVCYTKKSLTYYEVYYQFKFEVLHIDSYNDNILAKIFRKDVQDSPEAHQELVV